MNNRKLIIEEISRMRSMMGLNENYVPTLLLESKDPKALIDALVTFAKGADAAKGNLIRGMDAETKEFFNSRLAEYGDEVFGAGSAIKSIDDLVNATKAAELAAFSKKLASEFDNVKALIKSQGFDFSKYVYLPKFIQPTVTDKNIKNLIKQLPDTALLKDVLEKAKNKDFANIADTQLVGLTQHIAALRQANISNGNMRKYLDGIMNDLKTLMKDKSDWNVLEDTKLGDNVDNNSVFVQNFKNKAGNDIEAKLNDNDATGDSIIVTNKSVDPPTETIYYRAVQEPLDQESVLYRFDEEGNIVLFKQGEEFKADGWKDDNGVIVFTKDNVDYVTDKDSASKMDGKDGPDSWFTKNEVKKTEPENVTELADDLPEGDAPLTEALTPKEQLVYNDINKKSDSELKKDLQILENFRNQNKTKSLDKKQTITCQVLLDRGLINEEQFISITTPFEKSQWKDVYNFMKQRTELRKGLQTEPDVKKSDDIYTQLLVKKDELNKTRDTAKRRTLEGEIMELEGIRENKLDKFLQGLALQRNTKISNEFLGGGLQKFTGNMLSRFVESMAAIVGKYGWKGMLYFWLKIGGGLGTFWAINLILDTKRTIGNLNTLLSKKIGLTEIDLRTRLLEWSQSKDPQLGIGADTKISICPGASFCGIGISENDYKIVDLSLGIFVTAKPYYQEYRIGKFVPTENLSTESDYVISMAKDNSSLSNTTKRVINDYMISATGANFYTEEELKIINNTITTKGSLGEGKTLNDNIKTKMKDTHGNEFPDVLIVTDGKFDSKTGDIETYSFTVVKPDGEKVPKTLQYDTKTKLFKK